MKFVRREDISAGEDSMISVFRGAAEMIDQGTKKHRSGIDD